MENDIIIKPDYIVGFTDGEGTFSIVKYPDGRIRPQFLLFNTDKQIVERIKQALNLDSPIYEVIRVKDIIKRRKKCYRLQARSRKDIEKIIQFFDSNLPIIKIRDYKFFRETYQNWISDNSKL